MSGAAAGAGSWVTVFANPGHAYMTVAGLRLDTSAADDPSNQQGPRWRPLRPANAASPFATRSGLLAAARSGSPASASASATLAVGRAQVGRPAEQQ